MQNGSKQNGERVSVPCGIDIAVHWCVLRLRDYHRRDEEGLSLHITAGRKGEDDEVVVGKGLPLNQMETEGSYRDVLVSKYMSMHMHS